MLDWEKITHQPDIRILGITLSQNLQFDSHIWAGSTNMIKSSTYKTSLLKTLKPFLPHKALARIGNGLINSTILYGAPVWGVTKKANIEKIQQCQIKAGRTIDGYGKKGSKSHRQTLLDKLKWPNVCQIINSAILNQTKRAINGKASNGLNKMFTSKFPKLQRGNQGWRIKNKIPVKENKTSFPTKAQELYNNLPPNLRDITLTTLKFKKQLRPHTESNHHLKCH